jgi:glycogen synthase
MLTTLNPIHSDETKTKYYGEGLNGVLNTINTIQKGIELIDCDIEEIASMDMQFIILGYGEQKYENLFRHMAKKYPDKISAHITFSSKLARKIYAGADMTLMPSKFEPCGLVQMISLRYGAIPIVRETDGLKDTVKETDSAFQISTHMTCFLQSKGLRNVSITR